MATKKGLMTLETKVRKILEMFEDARDDDRILTLRVHSAFYGIDTYTPYCRVMMNGDIPSQESIGRVRRRLQEKDESLRGSKAKEKIRMEEQKAYIAYALES